MRRDPVMGVWLLRGLVAALAVLVVAAGCGSGDSDDAQVASVEADASSVEASSESALDDDGSEPTDDEAEADGDEVVGGGTVDYQWDPLPETNGDAALAALVADVHGPVGDLSVELNRVTRFPTVPTPAGSVLQEAVFSTGYDEEERARNWVDAELLVQESGVSVQSAFEELLVADGWNLESTSFDPDRFIEEPHERRIYQLPGVAEFAFDRLTVTTIDADPVRLVLSYRTERRIDQVLSDRFQGFVSDDIPLPPDGRYLSVYISTKHGPGLTVLNVSAEYDYSAAPISSAAELGASIESLAAAGPHEVELVTVDTVNLGVDGYDRYQVRFLDGLVKISTEQTFPTPDPGEAISALETPDQASTPLGDGASPEEFEAVMADIHGSTADVSAQMQRLGPFPDLPTPLEAEILKVDSGLSASPDDPGLVRVHGSVEMAVGGEFTDVDNFYQAQMAGGGWQLSRVEEGADDPELSKVVRSYTNPDIEASVGAPVIIEVIDDPVNARVQVTIDYHEYVPAAEGDWVKWSGWAGDVPVADGGELVSMSVSSFRWRDEAASLFATYLYPDLERDDVLPAVEEVSSADYTRNPGGDDATTLAYTHSYFDLADVQLTSWPGGAAMWFEARFTFGE